MKLSGNQTLDISALIGAWVCNTHGAEYIIIGVGADITNHRIIIELRDLETGGEVGVNWNDISDWEIQLTPRTIPTAPAPAGDTP